MAGVRGRRDGGLEMCFAEGKRMWRVEGSARRDGEKRGRVDG